MNQKANRCCLLWPSSDHTPGLNVFFPASQSLWLWTSTPTTNFISRISCPMKHLPSLPFTHSLPFPQNFPVLHQHSNTLAMIFCPFHPGIPHQTMMSAVMWWLVGPSVSYFFDHLYMSHSYPLPPLHWAACVHSHLQTLHRLELCSSSKISLIPNSGHTLLLPLSSPTRFFIFIFLPHPLVFLNIALTSCLYIFFYPSPFAPLFQGFCFLFVVVFFEGQTLNHFSPKSKTVFQNSATHYCHTRCYWVPTVDFLFYWKAQTPPGTPPPTSYTAHHLALSSSPTLPSYLFFSACPYLLPLSRALKMNLKGMSVSSSKISSASLYA